jgi:hypothetical protein
MGKCLAFCWQLADIGRLWTTAKLEWMKAGPHLTMCSHLPLFLSTVLCKHILCRYVFYVLIPCYVISKTIYLINGGSSSSNVVEWEPEWALFCLSGTDPGTGLRSGFGSGSDSGTRFGSIQHKMEYKVKKKKNDRPTCWEAVQQKKVATFSELGHSLCDLRRTLSELRRTLYELHRP